MPPYGLVFAVMVLGGIGSAVMLYRFLKLRKAARAFLGWYEDNFGEESYLDIDDNDREVWRSNYELREYQELAKNV